MVTKYYLKPNVFIEPLVNQWYASPYCVAPHLYAMIMNNLHFKIMQSYIKSPSLHANAVKNPKMLGGPFMDLPGEQTGIVNELLERTRRENPAMTELAHAIKNLDNLLVGEAKGFSLDELYSRIPNALKGFVELGYDLNNQPSIRFLERLLYKSQYYREDAQGFALSITHQDYRPFVFSTPRFPNNEAIHYKIPFKSKVFDRLFSMRETPQPLAIVDELMPEDEQPKAFFEGLFTERAPELRGRDRDSLGDKVRIKYCGHAVVLIETKDVSIITDPILSYDIGAQGVSRFTHTDMPEVIDYVLISHNHQDHLLFETLLQMRHKIRHIVVPKSNGGFLQDPSMRLILENTGFSNIIELEEMETLSFPGGGTLTGIPFLGEHADLHIRSKLGYFLELNNRTIALAADSNNLSPEVFDLVRQHLGAAETLFLGMECQGAPLSWLYGGLLTKPLDRRMDQSRRFDGSDYRKGMEMINSLGCQKVFVYAMGQEPWITFISSLKYNPDSKPIVESDKLVEDCLSQGIESERLFAKKTIVL